jgi:hypothetical protein
MASAAARRMEYERVFQAVGREAQRQKLRDICLLEVEGGIVLQGHALVSTRDGYQLTFETQVLSHGDLEKLMREL